MTCLTRLVNKWRGEIGFCALTHEMWFKSCIIYANACKRLEFFCVIFLESPLGPSRDALVVRARVNKIKARLPLQIFALTALLCMGERTHHAQAHNNEINKNARALAQGRWKRPILRFGATSFRLRERRKLFQRTIRILHMNAFSKRRAAMNEWISRTCAHTKKLSATTNNNSKIVAAAKHEDIISSKELGGGILVILLHRALRFAHR
jgi:hypothetical protein